MFSPHDRRKPAAWLTALAAALLAWPPTAGAQTPATSAPVARFAATTANLKGGPDAVRIDVLSWSADAARGQFVDAWNMIAPAPGAGGGRGARGTRGGGGAEAPPAAAGRGARGAARGGPPAGIASTAAAPAPNTPERSLAAALQAAEGVGYLWTSESTGYSLRYAYRSTATDGGERIILATDRRLGGAEDLWQPLSGAATDYGFSVIELRLNAKQEGEGKVSLTGKVAIDSSANTIALADYAALPVTLRNVKPR